ncbi:hypothetical protein F5883DRAFT_23908 [Diaporthe sp. PMI_573]|nr:hypothetical protein F5883DRAFT_23908 [Diaporthaceae sp. PMI_573]
MICRGTSPSPSQQSPITSFSDEYSFTSESSASTIECEGLWCRAAEVGSQVANHDGTQPSWCRYSPPEGIKYDQHTMAAEAVANKVDLTCNYISWSVHRFDIRGGTPSVLIHSSPLVWLATDVAILDPDALDNFCAHFTTWGQFFDPTANDHKILPLCPPEALPGRHRILNILDMVLREGIWYVVIRIELYMSLGEVQHNDEIRPWVVRDLNTKRWPGLG